MKLKAACIGTPPEVTAALSSSQFANAALQKVVGEALGVKDVLDRPAEYYLQAADEGPSAKEGVMGVEVRLTGASRNGRTPKQFHDAIRALDEVVQATVLRTLASCQKCQVFCVIMVDEQVETAPGSGVYSNTLESKPVWVQQRDHETG